MRPLALIVVLQVFGCGRVGFLNLTEDSETSTPAPTNGSSGDGGGTGDPVSDDDPDPAQPGTLRLSGPASIEVESCVPFTLRFLDENNEPATDFIPVDFAVLLGRGRVFTDPDCAVLLAGPFAPAAAESVLYLRSDWVEPFELTASSVGFESSTLNVAVTDPGPCGQPLALLDPPTGDGTPGAPYLLCTAEQLDFIRENSTASYLLERNVSLANWSGGPIGTIANEFKGTFDGGGHTLRDWTFEAPAENNVGLFGVIGSGATVGGVVLENFRVEGRQHVGALVGLIRQNGAPGTVSDATVDAAVTQNGGFGGGVAVGAMVTGSILNVTSRGSVTGLGDSRETGGLVGYASLGTISNSRSEATVSGSDDVGGLIGTCDGALEITDSVSNGNVIAGTNPSSQNLGGFIGSAFPLQGSDCVIRNSVANGNVTDPNASAVGGFVGRARNLLVFRSSATGDVNGDRNVGGFAGEVPADGVLGLVRSSGNVSGSSNVGGAAGVVSGALVLSSSVGPVSGTSLVGGLAGRINAGGLVAESFSDSPVFATAGPSVGGATGNVRAGGLILESYARGPVSGGGSPGGLAGNGVIDGAQDSYWVIEDTGLNSSALGTALSRTMAAEISSYENWDFEQAWQIPTPPASPLHRWAIDPAFSCVARTIEAGAVYSGTFAPNPMGGTGVYTRSPGDAVPVGVTRGREQPGYVGMEFFREVPADARFLSVKLVVPVPDGLSWNPDEDALNISIELGIDPPPPSSDDDFPIDIDVSGNRVTSAGLDWPESGGFLADAFQNNASPNLARLLGEGQAIAQANTILVWIRPSAATIAQHESGEALVSLELSGATLTGAYLECN